MCRSAQWKPSTYLLAALKGWSAVTIPASRCQNMADLRVEIDRLDRALVSLLAERQTYIERAAEIKTKRSRIRDQARIEDVVAKVLIAAKAAGLSPAIAEPVWRTLIEACIAHEHDAWDALRQEA
jgi:isochorismate pyruvate lyase